MERRTDKTIYGMECPECKTSLMTMCANEGITKKREYHNITFCFKCNIIWSEYKNADLISDAELKSGK